MNELEKEVATTVATTNGIVEAYHATGPQDGAKLVELMKDLSTILFFASTLKSTLEAKFNERVVQLTQTGQSVASAERIVNDRLPELTTISRLINSADRVFNAMRSQVSYLKTEMNSNV